MKKLTGKDFALIVGGVSLILLVFLIAGLAGLTFKPAVPFAYVDAGPQRQASLPDQTPNWHSLIYLLVILAILLVVIFLLLPPDLRKKFLRGLAVLAIVGLLLFLILMRTGVGPSIAKPAQGGGGPAVTVPPEPTGTPAAGILPVSYQPPQVSPWVSYGLSLGFLLLAAGTIALVMMRRDREETPYEQLAVIAEAALEDLGAGKDWGDAVLNCYYRMTRAVEAWRGIRRREGMTPAEFARYLVSAGLPQAAVTRLTGLFERARYGGGTPAPDEKRAAMESLQAILDFCEAGR